MKLRVLIFSILAIFLLNTAGYFPIFKIKQWLFQYKMETLISSTFVSDSLTCISILSDNQNELHWERDNEEFWYKGELYDIVRLEKKDGFVFYYCVEDTPETELYYQFAENIKKQTQNDNDDSSPLSNLFKKILELDLPPANRLTIPIEFIGYSKKNKEYLPYLNLYNSIFYHSIDPPPKPLI